MHLRVVSLDYMRDVQGVRRYFFAQIKHVGNGILVDECLNVGLNIRDNTPRGIRCSAPVVSRVLKFNPLIFALRHLVNAKNRAEQEQADHVGQDVSVYAPPYLAVSAKILLALSGTFAPSRQSDYFEHITNISIKVIKIKHEIEHINNGRNEYLILIGPSSLHDLNQNAYRTMTDDSLTARNRINQRNFRARRQNYIKELEERIRKYESDGVQATIEIQSAARQVTDQNIKLRNLLISRFGMSEYEISNYLGFQQSSSPLGLNQPFPSVFTTNSQFPNLAPTPSGGIAPKPQLTTEVSHSYPTPPQQSEFPRSLTSAHLDPALSLASLHKFPPTNYDQPSLLARHDSSQSAVSTADSKSQSYSSRPPDSPTDTLSESSDPTTPAEQMQTDHPQPIQPLSQQASMSCYSSDSNKTTAGHSSRPNDETACEEAARIIASMRGGDGNADQVMLELGCSNSDDNCKVKNLSIFQLMDRG